MIKSINTPLTEDITTELKAGDSILLNGTIYTARDAAHGRLINLLNDGKEVTKILNDLLTFFRNILMYKNVSSSEFYNVLYDNLDFVDLASKIQNQRVYYYVNILNDTIENVKWTVQKRPYFQRI